MGFPQHLPEELAIDILSRLPVKSLMRFKCVSKSWKSLISDSQFVKLHLHRSISRSTDFAQNVNDLGRAYLSSRSITSLLKSHSQSRVWLSEYKIIGTCNGLICLSKEESDNLVGKNCSWIRFWNPATRLVSQSSPPLSKIGHCFGFGYDCSSDTYKVVAVKIIDVVVKPVKQVEVEQYNGVTLVNVYSIGNNCWRRIHVSFDISHLCLKPGAVYVSGTVNWFAALADLVLHNHGQPMDTDPYVIVSFDLGKEEFTQLSLPYCPRLRDELSDFVPILGVLRGCLCISQNNRTTHNLTVWQMKEFGVHASWTRLFNIVGDENIFFSPCFASFISDESGDALLFPEPGVALAVLLYRRRAKKFERTNIPNHIIDCKVNNYVESLISPY